MTEEPVDIGLDWQLLSVDELKLVLDQADVLGAGFPDRPGVGNIFSIIAGAAIYAT